MGQVQSDITGDLPTEVGIKILSYLDEDSLVSAVGVNRLWNAIGKRDPILRRRIHIRLQQDEKSCVQSYTNEFAGGEVTRINPVIVLEQQSTADEDVQIEGNE